MFLYSQERRKSSITSTLKGFAFLLSTCSFLILLEELYFFSKIELKMCIEHIFKQQHTQKHKQCESKSMKKKSWNVKTLWARKYLDSYFNSTIPVAYIYTEHFLSYLAFQQSVIRGFLA